MRFLCVKIDHSTTVQQLGFRRTGEKRINTPLMSI
jgi:hypothetical protein